MTVVPSYLVNFTRINVYIPGNNYTFHNVKVNAKKLKVIGKVIMVINISSLRTNCGLNISQLYTLHEEVGHNFLSNAYKKEIYKY